MHFVLVHVVAQGPDVDHPSDSQHETVPKLVLFVFFVFNVSVTFSGWNSGCRHEAVKPFLCSCPTSCTDACWATAANSPILLNTCLDKTRVKWIVPCHYHELCCQDTYSCSHTFLQSDNPKITLSFVRYFWFARTTCSYFIGRITVSQSWGNTFANTRGMWKPRGWLQHKYFHDWAFFNVWTVGVWNKQRVKNLEQLDTALCPAKIVCKPVNIDCDAWWWPFATWANHATFSCIHQNARLDNKLGEMLGELKCGE